MIQTRFTSGVTIGAVNGGGYLELAPNELRIVVGKASALLTGVSEIRSSERKVQVIRTRWMFPWIGLSVPVSDGVNSGIAVMPTWLRRVLVENLELNGFEVVETIERFRTFPRRDE